MNTPSHLLDQLPTNLGRTVLIYRYRLGKIERLEFAALDGLHDAFVAIEQTEGDPPGIGEIRKNGGQLGDEFIDRLLECGRFALNPVRLAHHSACGDFVNRLE